MNFASAVVLTILVILFITAIRHLLKKGSGCSGCGHCNDTVHNCPFCASAHKEKPSKKI